MYQYYQAVVIWLSDYRSLLLSGSHYRALVIWFSYYPALVLSLIGLSQYPGILAAAKYQKEGWATKLHGLFLSHILIMCSNKPRWKYCSYQARMQFYAIKLQMCPVTLHYYCSIKLRWRCWSFVSKYCLSWLSSPYKVPIQSTDRV
jgi:hypothetical protein